jgi:hypothetical protein
MESESTTTTDAISSVARDRTATEAVVGTVAEVKGVSPLDLAPLYNVIDPDALDEFCRAKWSQPPQSLSVEFQYESCTVIVGGDGEVTVQKLDTPEGSA